ncbi:MAG: hypothetical protein J6Y78_10240 [Paludibacteraceae bacterium]|nr:hypothetical protein [Paludibacteraceae bacterium]
MKILRTAIKSVFYDYPLVDLLGLIQKEEGRDKQFLNDINMIMSVRAEDMNQAVIKQTGILMKREWMKYDYRHGGQGAFDRCLMLLKTWTDNILTKNRNEAVVRFEHLLKWRETTLLIGEELPMIIYLAGSDTMERTDFCWKEVADTDCVIIDDALKDGVCDIHSHLNATSNSFIFGWISLMNQIIGREENFKWLQNPMDNPVVLHDYRYSDLYQWCILAAKIRSCLYSCFVLDDLKEENIFEKVFSGKSDFWLSYYNDNVKDVQDDIDFLRHLTITYYDSTRFIDYAVNVTETDVQSKSPYIVLYGERQITYKFFRKYLKRQLKDKRIAHLVYLYERIKTEYRKELLYTNRKTGLTNFKNYNCRKEVFSRQDSTLRDARDRFGIQTSIDDKKHYAEGRVCVGTEEYIYKLRYNRSINTDERLYFKDECDRLSIVYHLLKEPDFKGQNRYRRDKRETWKAEMGKAVAMILDSGNLYTGIDFAGSEVCTRPEIVAHLVRYAKAWGINNITYHAGEDFFDVIDGLRTIDEAALFFELGEGQRIGHALALGLNVHAFYTRNSYELVLPRQYLLDNIIWLILKSKAYKIIGYSQIIKSLINYANELYRKIGYSVPFDADKYFGSMSLRSDDVEVCDNEYPNNYTPWLSTILLRGKVAEELRTDREIIQLRDEYLLNTIIYSKGNEPEHFEISLEYEKLVQAVQLKLRKEIEGKKIAIESNPTSNVLISNIKGYDEHPIFILRQPDSHIGNQFEIGLGTDDKGIMATSLKNEYALIAAALREKKQNNRQIWNDSLVEAYLKGMAGVSMKHRFTKDGNKAIFVE